MWRINKPKRVGRYLVTTYDKSDDERSVEILWYGKAITLDGVEKGFHWYRSDIEYGDILYDDEVIAWQELPEPLGRIKDAEIH